MLLKRALSFFGSSPNFGLGAGGDKPPPEGDAVPTLNLKPKSKKPKKKEDVPEEEYPEDAQVATDPPWRGTNVPIPPPPSGGYSWVAGAWGPAPSEAATAASCSAPDNGPHPHTGPPAAHIDLRQCHRRKEWSYLRKGACCNSQCVPFLHVYFIFVFCFIMLFLYFIFYFYFLCTHRRSITCISLIGDLTNKEVQKMIGLLMTGMHLRQLKICSAGRRRKTGATKGSSGGLTKKLASTQRGKREEAKGRTAE